MSAWVWVEGNQLEKIRRENGTMNEFGSREINWRRLGKKMERVSEDHKSGWNLVWKGNFGLPRFYFIFFFFKDSSMVTN